MVIEQRPLSEIEQKIANDVQRHGCSIMSVFDPEGEEPDFSYSIGFPEKLAQPEVIVFSLPKNLRASMINELYRQMSAEGLVMHDGQRVSDLLVGHDCILREVRNGEAIAEHFGSAIWYSRRFHDRELQQAFQIVWPGAQQGLFPWEEGCSQAVIDDQPALYSTGLNS